ncbi:MAG: MFS transporter, partial [Candidatus Latescibacterota bacterium]|nr:MFS transporter [Candidatus Latescibacterota bacterium]
GLANSFSSLVVVFLAPLLGAIADQGGTRRKFLFAFAFLGILATGCLYLVSEGAWILAVFVYALAAVGFSGANTFYDSLLVAVADREASDFVSALGYSLGYLGGGLLFALNVAMVLHPQTFGLADATQAVRVCFLMVAIWWAVFSIPLWLWVEESTPIQPNKGWRAISAGYRQLIETFREIRRLRVTFVFLISYWLYIDGVDTIVRMAVDYGMSIGFATDNLLLALGITQFVGFPAAIIFGKLGEKIGTRKGLFIGLAAYIAVTVWGYFLDEIWEFYLLATAVGLVQGGVQALSRSLYSRLIPRNRAAEFFGFYNMLGKFAAVIGPALMGWVAVLTGNPRFGILSIVLLFIAGGVFLCFVDEEQGVAAAQKLETP